MNSMHFHFLCLVLTLNIELLGGGRMAFFAFFTGGGDTQRRVGPCPLPFVAMPPFDEPPRATCRFYDAFLVYGTIRAVKRRLRWGGGSCSSVMAATRHPATCMPLPFVARSLRPRAGHCRSSQCHHSTNRHARCLFYDAFYVSYNIYVP